MKTFKSIFVLVALFVGVNISAQAQDSMKKSAMADTQVVALEQTKGQFTQKSVELKPGDYVFAISNNNSGTDVGFVLVPKGKDATKAENHIQSAYVTQVVAEGETQKSKVVNLQPGEYVYFCPLNKTPQYTLTVK